MPTDNNRAPRFELHIRPMMRLLDTTNMNRFRGMDLWDYDVVRDASAAILAKIGRDMPPLNAGGLWPREWVEVFKRWTETDFLRLEIGRPDGDWQIGRFENEVTLAAQCTLPDESYEAWIEPAFTREAWRVYTLYWQAPDEAPTPPLTPRQAIVEDVFQVAASENIVVVVDANGRHELAL